jgi:hypothetical protein
MKIARVKTKEDGETYGIVADNFNNIITKNEIQEQTGIPLPLNIKEFLFNNWIEEVLKNYGKLNFQIIISELELLEPLPIPIKSLCLAFNYFDLVNCLS